MDGWGPYEYRRWLVRTHFPRGGRLLDVGCGTGMGTLRTAVETGLEAHGVDVIDSCQARIQFQKYDGSTLPFPNAFFDALTIIHVLHHADDARALIAECARVTRPGGRLMVIEDIASSRLQTFLTGVSDWYGNRARNLYRALLGRQKLAMVQVPMRYGYRTYPQWMAIFAEHGLTVIDTMSIAHALIEHGVFILERRPPPPSGCG